MASKKTTERVLRNELPRFRRNGQKGVFCYAARLKRVSDKVFVWNRDEAWCGVMDYDDFTFDWTPSNTCARELMAQYRMPEIVIEEGKNGK